MKKFLAITLVILMLSSVLCLSACKGGRHTGASKKDTITRVIPGTLSTASPYLHCNLDDLVWQIEIYEPLIWLNDVTGEFEPRLAKSYEISPDGLTYTFKLRDDVYFHNGEKMTAQDCVFSYNLAKESTFITVFTNPYESVEALDDTTFVVHLKDVYYPFLHHSTMIKIVSQKAVEEQGESFGTKVVLAGTGPYYMTSYEPSVGVKMEAFDKYYRGKPSIKYNNFVVMTDASAAFLAFKGGDVDFLEIVGPDWKHISSDSNFCSQKIQRQQLYYLCINFNSEEHPELYQNIDFRKALAYCIDRNSIIEISTDGLGIPAYQYTMPEYTAGCPKAPAIKYEYDLDKAREYLEKAGYPDGVDIGKMTVLGTEKFLKLAQVLQSSCAQIGITFEIDQRETSAALVAMRGDKYSFGVMSSMMMLDYDYISRYFHTRDHAAAFVKYKDSPLIDYKRVDELFDKGAAQSDIAERQAIYTELEDILLNSATYIPIMFSEYGYAWQKDLNVDPGKFGPYFTFSAFDWSWNN